MDRVGRERGQTHSDVFSATRLRTGIANPFASGSYNRLTGLNIQGSTLVLNTNQAVQHDRDLLKIRALTRFHPPLWRHHSRHAHLFVTAVDASGVLFDAFGKIAGGLNNSGSFDESGHTVSGTICGWRPPEEPHEPPTRRQTA